MPAQIAELEAKSTASDIWDDQQKANELFAKLRGLKKQWDPVIALKSDVDGLVEMTQMATLDDVPALQTEYEKAMKEWAVLEPMLYLSGEFDHNNCYITISGGAGGTEAQDWAGFLMRMYLRYCERMEWTTSIVDKTDGQEAGIKTVTIFVEGDPAYGYLKCEKGTHRLVRLSPFNAKSLRQTSFALVEVLPEITNTDEVVINANDLRVDTYRASGAGGQHVNKTDSAIRITHIPTNIVVAVQTERSQIQNRERAMNLLKAKLLEKKRAEELEQKQELKGASQSASFGQQIRSYVLHPYQMVKDLRTDVETSNTQGALDGDIQMFIDAELKRLARQ